MVFVESGYLDQLDLSDEEERPVGQGLEINNDDETTSDSHTDKSSQEFDKSKDSFVGSGTLKHSAVKSTAAKKKAPKKKAAKKKTAIASKSHKKTTKTSTTTHSKSNASMLKPESAGQSKTTADSSRARKPDATLTAPTDFQGVNTRAAAPVRASSITTSVGEDLPVNCVCGDNREEEGVNYILCDGCRAWLHCICVG